MRFFNTKGPVRPNDHYGIPPLDYMAPCGAAEGHLAVMDRRSVAKERRYSEGAEDRRDGEGGGGAEGSVEPRQDARGVVVWML